MSSETIFLAVLTFFAVACVMEKLDGNIMTLFHYDNNWHVSSSKVPDAGGLVPGQTVRHPAQPQ